MGNFFTNDPGGALLGTLAGKLINDAQARQHNARWKEAYGLTQQQLGVNDADKAAAEKKVLADMGMEQYLGMDPREGILQNKEAYGKAQAGYNSALAAGDTEQQKYYQGLMDSEHGKADFLRKIGGVMGLDLAGYGSNNTLDEATKRQINKLVQAQNPMPPSTVGTTLTDLAGGRTGALGTPTPEMQRQRANQIAMEDFRKAYGDEFAQLVEEAAENEARARIRNPQWNKELEDKLREIFISPQIIGDMLQYGQDQRQQVMSKEAIDDAIGQMKRGNAAGYYGAGLRAMPENPALAKTILSGAPTPRDFYGTQMGRENMALQHGYRLDTLGKQYELGEKKADAAFERTAKLNKLNMYEQVELMLRTSNIKNEAERERLLMLYGAFKEITGSHEEALKYAFGDGLTGKGRSTQSVSPQYKAASDYVKSWQAAHKSDLDNDWQSDPTYQSALEVIKVGFAPQQTNATLAELSTGVNSMIKSLSGSAGESEASINAVRSALEKYKGQLSPEQMGNINQYLDGANAIRELRAGYTDQARKYAGGVDLTILQRLGITKEELNTLAVKPRARAPRQEVQVTAQTPQMNWSGMVPDEDPGVGGGSDLIEGAKFRKEKHVDDIEKALQRKSY